MFEKITRFHFVGIGGIGMSGIAELLLRQGYHVSGSDQYAGPTVENLRGLGARIEIGHRSANPGWAEAVVYSSAINPDNPELVDARKRGIPLVHRAEMLSELMRYKKGITITGTHGKTTTTSMVASILLGASLDPTVVVGAKLPEIGSNAHLGQGEHMVVEADESDRSFLHFRPTYTLVTNIDQDHMDEYRDLKDLEETFLEHMKTIPFYGKLVACSDDPVLLQLLRNVHIPVVTYGLKSGADISADEVAFEGLQASYRALWNGDPLGQTQLGLPGRHNVLNSLGATALGLVLGIPFEVISESLRRFKGPERRLQLKGERLGVTVYDDYGHHPAEIKASLAACAPLKRRIVLIYQPHRFTRTLHSRDELVTSFSGADRLYLLDVYAAGEQPIEGVTSEDLAKRISEHRQAQYVGSSEEMLHVLETETAPGDLVLTMGAGDVWRIGEAFLEKEVN